MPTFLMQLVGIPSLNLNVGTIATIKPPLGGNCLSGGFFTRGKVSSNSNNDYLDRFCLHGEQGVTIQSNTYFERGTTVSMALVQSTFFQSQDNIGVAEALKEATVPIFLPDSVDGILASMRAGDLSGLPDYITKVVRRSGELTYEEVIAPGAEGTLFIVDKADFGSGSPANPRIVKNIAVVGTSDVKTGSDVILSNVVLATSGRISLSFGKFGATFGEPGYCETGKYSIYAFAGDNIEIGSFSTLQGMQMVTQKMLKLGSNLTVSGTYAEAIGDIEYGSNSALAGCKSDLESEVEDTVVASKVRMVY